MLCDVHVNPQRKKLQNLRDITDITVLRLKLQIDNSWAVAIVDD